MDKKVIAITGASSGIGRYTAIALMNMGHIVYDLSRRNIPNGNVKYIKTDVTDEENVRASIDEIIKNEKRIDVVINCAGYGISGAVEFTRLCDAKRQFDVNFFGMVNVNKAVIPYMRKEGKGLIINISSVAAVTHIPFQTYYSASKAAVESYTCALANELKPFGIFVSAIQPGDICTEFTSARNKSFLGDDVYEGRISRSVEGMEKDEQKGMSPEFAGKYIAKVALKKRPKPIYAIGFSYKAVCLLCKVVPCGWRNKIIGSLYAK
ncbi:MAG: SDR family oxidoreductase [Clostridia bacterium]|nr:SDR family oxidoreductase [Clostridia bacterium]